MESREFLIKRNWGKGQKCPKCGEEMLEKTEINSFGNEQWNSFCTNCNYLLTKILKYVWETEKTDGNKGLV